MQANSKTSPLPDAPPKLVRSTTVHGVAFTVPEEQIECQVDDVTVKVMRTRTHTQPLADILDELPDDIKEIVTRTINNKD